jgi:hypothetical protein
MSVTFSIEALPTGAFQVSAACEWDAPLDDRPIGAVVHASYDAAIAVVAAHRPTCEDCAHYSAFACAVLDVDDALDVNVSNVNARTLLIALGLGDAEDLSGIVDGADFQARVMLALATDRDDSGVAPAVIGGASLGQTGATMIDCGLAPGYFADRFGALYALAQEAARLGRSVQWS